MEFFALCMGERPAGHDLSRENAGMDFLGILPLAFQVFDTILFARDGISNDQFETSAKRLP